MVRKRDRVIGTLLIWIGILITMSMILDRMNSISLYLQNNWYNSVNVVTGADPAEATQLFENIQSISNDLYFQVRQIAFYELTAYLPVFVFIGIALLVAGILSTYFIWRSVVVPEAIRETIAAHQEEGNQEPSSRQSLANLLDDDGEILAPTPDLEPEQNHGQNPS